MDVQDALIEALTAQVSSLQGHLAMALGEIRALQAKEQARTDAPEGTSIEKLVTNSVTAGHLTNHETLSNTDTIGLAMEATKFIALEPEGHTARNNIESSVPNSNLSSRRTKLSFAIAAFIGTCLTWWKLPQEGWYTRSDVAYANGLKERHLRSWDDGPNTAQGVNEIKKLEIEL
ncbi:hypothetical protein Tco_0694558 [Tanacetum coccineum]